MATQQKLSARIERRKAAGKNTKKAEASLAARKAGKKETLAKKAAGRGIGKSGAASKISAERLKMRSERRAAAGKGTKRATKSTALKEKLAAAKSGGKTKRATRLTNKIKSRAAAAKTRRTARKSAK